MEYKDCKINLFNIIYSIKFVDEIKDETSEKEGTSYPYGMTNFRSKIIIIAKKDHYSGRAFTKDEISITLLHEILHAVSSEGMYTDINDNEPFIDWAAKCLHNIIKNGTLRKCGVLK